MHRHDPDLIMSLAEGRLPAVRAEAAAAEIATCDECRTDLEYQREALRALQAAPPVELTAGERSSLRAALTRQLNLESPDAAAAAEPRVRTMPRWWRAVAGLGTAAAVLLALVLVAPALDFLAPSGSDDAADFAAESADTSIAAETEARTSSDAASGGQGDGLLEAAGQEGHDGGKTTVPAPTTTIVAAPPAGETFLPFLSRTDTDTPTALDELRTLVIAEGGDADTIRRRLTPLADRMMALGPDIAERCAVPIVSNSAELVAALPIAFLSTGTDEGLVIAYIPADPSAVRIVMHEPSGCEVLDSTGDS